MTQTLHTGFNLVGLTLHSSPAASGAIGTVTSSLLSDPKLNLTPQAGALYILEITSGTGNGVAQEIAAANISSGSIILTDNITAMGVVSGDSYLLRKAPTLEDIFGTVDSPLKKGATPGAADIVWIPNGAGGYDRYFLNTFNAWRNAGGGAAANTPVVYLDGFFVQRKDAPVSFTLTGQVKTGSISVMFSSGFNLIGTSFPAGATLQNIGFDATVKKGATPGVADLIWIPNSTGGYDRYFLNTFNAWRNAGGGAAPVDLPLTSAVFLQRKDPAGNLKLNPPPSYSNL